MNEKLITRDRMRYEKNKLSSSLALVAIVFNAIYFAGIYRGVFENTGSYYYNILVGGSVLINLAFMLTAFLSSEGVKNYKTGFAITLLVLAALQIGRIFVYPVGAHTTEKAAGSGVMVMGTPQFIRCLVYLLASAACLIVAGVFGIIRSNQLKQHLAKYGDGKVDFAEGSGMDTTPIDLDYDVAEKAAKEKEETPVPIVQANSEDEQADAGVLGEVPAQQDEGKE